MGCMPWRELSGLARSSAGLPWFLRRPLSLAAASAAVAERVRKRETAFLQAAEQLVFGVKQSPLRRLLRWAGCELGDLRRQLMADGLEATLEGLRASGVWVSADEFRGCTPLRRSQLELETKARDFDNPLFAGTIAGRTSGSTGRSVPVRYSFPFLKAEAADELLLLESHGLQDAPLAFWLPGPPGIAGLHNLVVHAKLGRPPERWFSPSPAPEAGDGLAFWVDQGWRVARLLLSPLGPAPEWVGLERAEEVARWLAGSPRPALLKCFASSALRVASAAAAAGLDISGHVVFAGGEPLTDARRDFLSRGGIRVYSRYAATETGFVAGECPLGVGGMHLYADRLAVVAPPGRSGALAFTSLSIAAPKVLLNVELGDHGALWQKACPCVLGRAGLAWHVGEVHSPSKIAAEGVKLGELDFAKLVEDAVRDLGGSPEDFQIWLDLSESGAPCPTIALAPKAQIEPAALRRRLRERLPGLASGALAAKLWFDSGVLAVERRPLRLGPGQKMRRVIRAEPGSVRSADAP
jgi:hypothetical protein